jgi:predicted CoA-binding protein
LPDAGALEIARSPGHPITRWYETAPSGTIVAIVPTVAIIGASNDRRKFGNQALRAFRNQGYRVIPINPNETEVEGERAFASVLDVPGGIDEATVYVPPHTGLRVMEQLAQKGVGKVFLNPGADAPGVVARARGLGLKAVQACSIIAIGESPGDY